MSCCVNITCLWGCQIPEWDSVKTSSHFTGHISEALSKLWLRAHYPSGIMSTPTQKEAWEIGITCVFLPLHIQDNILSCFQSNGLKDQALLVSDKEKAAKAVVRSHIHISAAQTGCNQLILIRAHEKQKAQPLFGFINWKISNLSPGAWKQENSAHLLTPFKHPEFINTLGETFCPAFSASIHGAEKAREWFHAQPERAERSLTFLIFIGAKLDVNLQNKSFSSLYYVFNLKRYIQPLTGNTLFKKKKCL